MPLEQILRDFHLAGERLLMHVEELDPSLFARQAVHPQLKTPMGLVLPAAFISVWRSDFHSKKKLKHIHSCSEISSLR